MNIRVSPTINLMKDSHQPRPEEGRASILFAAPMSILDTSSGAAMSMRSLLCSLAARGFRVVALQAQLFDSHQGGEHIANAAAAPELEEHPLLQARVQGVEHLMVRTKERSRHDMTCAEQEVFIHRYRQELLHRRPDMVILWGTMLLETVVMREARSLGIPVVFYLVSGAYEHKETFRDVSVIVTDTQATADLYRQRFDLDCRPIGKFIEPAAFKAAQRRPEFITFINPSAEKGVNVFMSLARLAAREAPDIRFLVVQSRGRWDKALEVLNYKPEDFPNVTVIDHQKDMKPVYAVTRALLVPSVWYESGGRVIVEALINGIPVLASRSGGSAELVGQGGSIFELPEVVKEERDTTATDDVVRPWLDEICRIWRDPAYYDAVVAQADKEAARHDVQRNTDRFLAAVAPAIRQSSLARRKLQEPQAAGRPR